MSDGDERWGAADRDDGADVPARRGPAAAGGGTGTVLGVAAGVLVILLGVAVVLLLDDGDAPRVAAPSLTASPVPRPPGTPPAVPTGGPTAPGTASPSEVAAGRTSQAGSPSPGAEQTSPGQPPAERPPTDADAAGFAGGFQPGGPAADAQQVRSVAADTDGDGRDEVVVASLVGGFAQVDIASWDGRAYQVVFSSQGGSAEVLDDLRVTDYTGDDVREVLTRQSSGGGGQSLSVYGWDGQAYAPQIAQGGCWDGSSTYGVLGASIQPGQITATCDEPEVPLAAQPSDVYRWDGRAWVFDHREGGL